MGNPFRHYPSRSLLQLTLGCWLLFAGGVAVDASPWRSELYPENWRQPDAYVSFYADKLIQDFSYAGYRRGEEDIPVVAGPVFDVTGYGADPTGASDSTVAIQAAINAAAGAGGGVVFLPAGEFRVSPQGTNSYCLRIATSNVVLRGAGTADTFLLNTSHTMRDKSVILITPTAATTGTAVSITADLPGPTRRIPVANAGAFAPGDFVRIEWSFTAAWITEHNQQTWWSASSAPANARYYREVLAVNPAEGWIELDVPTRYSIKTRDSARVFRQSGLLTNVGVESLSIGNLQHPGTGWGENDYTDPTKAAYDTHNCWLIRISYTRDSWVSGVHSRQAAANSTTAHMLSNGISLVNCLRITVRDCAMRRPQYGGGGGNGYMYRIQHSNECLVGNCLAEFSRHGFVISHAGTSGNVFLFCDDRETARAVGSSPGGYTTSGSGSDNHMHFSHSNLWDSCHAHNSFWTAHHRLTSGTIPHGLTSAHGVYWNTTGSGTRGGDIVRSGQGRYGYVIGTSGSRSGASNPTGGNTAPADHLEGIGLGATLEPASLYLDQLARRLEPEVIYRDNGATTGSAPVDASSPYPPGARVTVLGAGDLARPHFAFSGWNTAADGRGTRYAPGSTFEITGSTILYAQWRYGMRVDAGPDQAVTLAGSAPWTPAQITAAAWYDAADPATLSQGGGAVSQWNDKSGHNNHASQATAANRPSTGLATVGGLATVSFRVAQQQHLSAADSPSLKLDASGGANLFSVFNYRGWVDQGSSLNVPLSKGQILSAEAAYGIRVSSGNVLSYKPGLGVQVDGGSGFLGQGILYSGTRNDNTQTSALHLNGALGAAVTSSTVITSDNSSPLLIGRDPSSTRFADVDFGEILVVGGALSADERHRIEGYLAHKWALAGDLPADHPYKAAAPLASAATVSLSGAVTDAIGDFLTHAWSVDYGPAAVVFADASALSTTATFTRKGVYVLRLTSHDSFGSSSGTVTVAVVDATDPSAFEAWAGGGAVTFDGDANGDGVPDGLAWLLGASDPVEDAKSLLPTGVLNNDALEVSFNLLNLASRGLAVMKLQYSPDLETWAAATVPDESRTHAGATFIISPRGDFNEVTAIVPIGGPGGKVFIRLIGELVDNR